MRGRGSDRGEEEEEEGVRRRKRRGQEERGRAAGLEAVG